MLAANGPKMYMDKSVLNRSMGGNSGNYQTLDPSDFVNNSKKNTAQLLNQTIS